MKTNKTYSIFTALLTLIIGISSANAYDNSGTGVNASGGFEETACVQVIPCDDNGNLLPGFTFENPCFSNFEFYCNSLKQKAYCKESMNSVYEENSALYTKVQKLEAKIKRLNKKNKVRR